MGKKKQELEAEVSYRIYEMTEGGLMREPQEDSLGHTSNLFDAYSGYKSMEEAQCAIVETGSQYERYFVLPTVRIVEKEAQ